MPDTIIIPKQHRAIIYDQPGTVSTKVVLVDTPEPGLGQVLIRLTHSGVCHSDYGIMTNSWSYLPDTEKGQVGGHEGVGTFQEFVLGPANYVTPIPDGLASENAALMLCAGLTIYSAFKCSEAKPGDFVIVSGAGGGLGHVAVQLGSRGLGFRIIAIDRSSKKELVLKSGAEHFVDMDEFSDDESLVDHFAPPTYETELLMLRPNGALVCVGVPEGEMQAIASAKPAVIIFKQLKIIGSAVGTREEAMKTLDFAARGIIDPHVTVAKMEDLTDIFHKMHGGGLKGLIVIDMS
ncbi:Alcohol dehydrogenase, C-terminal [Penicillium expansum]|nr:Alcohol dehydrogenase, C-terminal [Penicillium expansum]